MTAAAFTEPDTGSDTASFKLRAVKQGDGYLLKGAKMWCTFANRANILTVMARTDPDLSKKHRGLSLMLFEKTARQRFRAAPSDRIDDTDDRLSRHGQLQAVLRRRLRAGRQPDRRQGRPAFTS